jgi:homoserine dehydrogenase
MADTPILSIEEVITSYYMRMTVADQPGVLADIAKVLAEAGISIGSMIQQPSDADGSADLIFLTHHALEKNINAAIARIESLEFVRSCVTRLRVESLS